ncbi:MAG: metallophosphoesterase family protein [Planctomycetes bacterium]|nr:metallophosphoesterase family protein [Planctomycetota bacterium]
MPEEPPHGSDAPPAAVVGVISDTHGLLRPEALTALSGCGLILHAGDVGDPGVLLRLAALAPVVAVRGNTDNARWAARLRRAEVVEAAGRRLYVLHDLAALDLDPVAAGLAAVISGHSHEPYVAEQGGVLYLNPGSAGPKRFHLPVTLARIHLRESGLEAEIVHLCR